jgi:hypothetical protein
MLSCRSTLFKELLKSKVDVMYREFVGIIRLAKLKGSKGDIKKARKLLKKARNLRKKLLEKIKSLPKEEYVC